MLVSTVLMRRSNGFYLFFSVTWNNAKLSCKRLMCRSFRLKWQNPCCKKWITNFNAATDITGYNDVCLHFSTVRRPSTQTCVRWKTARSVTGSRAVSSASIAATRTSVACNGCALVIRTSSTSWTASVAPSACQTISKKSKRKTTNIHANVETGRFMRQKWLVGTSVWADMYKYQWIDIALYV